VEGDEAGETHCGQIVKGLGITIYKMSIYSIGNKMPQMLFCGFGGSGVLSSGACTC
jgi:hypothetical protein